jgi:outer membrane protein assembly factor BamB
MKAFLILFLVLVNLLFGVNSIAQNSVSIPIENCGESKTSRKLGVYDASGLFWYICPCGLVSETGNNTQLYEIEGPSGAKSNKLKALKLILSVKNELWMICRGYGVYRFNIDSKKGKWIITNEKLGSFAEDKHGNIWFSTAGNYVIRYQFSNDKVSRVYLPKNKFSLIKDESSFQVVANKHHFSVVIKGSTVLFSKERELFSFDAKKNQLVSLNVRKAPSDKLINFVERGHFSNLSQDGFFFFKKNRYAILYDSRTNIQTIEIPNELSFNNSEEKSSFELVRSETQLHKAGVRLIQKRGENLIFYSLTQRNNRLTLEEKNQFVLSSPIFDVIQGPNELAVITRNGIETIPYNSEPIQTHLSFQTPVIIPRVLHEHKGNHVLCQTNNGLYINRDGSFHFLPNEELSSKGSYQLNNALDILHEGDSLLWIIGIGKKITRLNYLTGVDDLYSTAKATKSKWAAGGFTSIERLNDSILLLAGKCGLFEFNISSGVLKPHHIKDARINSRAIIYIKKSNSGDIWLLGENELFKINKNQGVTTQLSSDFIFIFIKKQDKVAIQMYEDDNDAIWIVYADNSLIKFDLTQKTSLSTTRFTEFGAKIASLLQDGRYLWVTTFDGLYALDYSTLKVINSFSTPNGLPDPEFNINSALKTSDGRLFFGGMNGLISFRSEDLIRKEPCVQLCLMERVHYVSSENRYKREYLHNLPTSFTLKYDQNNLNLKFSVVGDLLNSKKYNYYYKIPEISNQWVDIGNAGYIQLQGLEPGNYRLMVKATSFGISDSPVLTYELNIEEVFFRTWWFRVLFLLLIGGLIYLAYRSIKKKQLTQFINDHKIKDLELRAVQAQMNPHFVHNTINNLQSVLLTKEITEINRYFQEFSQLVQHTLQISQARRISLKQKLTYLRSYLSLSNLRLNDELNYTITVDPEIDTANTFITPLIIQPIIENSIIHGLKPKKGEKNLNIKFEKYNRGLMVTIIDDGIGRELAWKINEESALKKDSLSSNILKKRLDLNERISRNISIQTIDIEPDEFGRSGTKVIIMFDLL